MSALGSSPQLKAFLKAVLDTPELQTKMQEEISTERLVAIAAEYGHQLSVGEVNNNALWQAGGFKYLY